MSSIVLGGALCGAAAAQAQDTGANYGPYVSIAGGINDPKSMDFALRNPITAAPTSRTANFNTGYNFNGAFGTKWTNGIRTELEVSYRKSGVDNISGTTVDGSQKTLSLMGNALYDIDTGSRLNFSVGGGVGVGRAKWDNVNGAGLPTFNDSDTNLQWQAIGEVGLPIGRQMSLFADYRYITLYDNNFISTTGSARASAGTDRSHNILVGLRYFFNS
ncbi:MAG: outer membrane protein [Rhodospirillaceae bacterium]